ncbi:MAG: putative rane protein [Solirubrobacteraceae bacterium]|jgi:putative membrane protein|nr:putative rane protein [Solirubrobacteraceae bacterium]
MGRGLTGEEPDARFTLAAERTYLAWIRTSLALIAGAVAASQFLDDDLPGARWALAIPLGVLGVAVAATSHHHWRAIDGAIRTGRPLPRSPVANLLAVGVTIVAVAACVLAIVDAF